MSGTGRPQVTVAALGVPIRIEVDDPSLVKALEQAWEWCLLDPATPPTATVTVTNEESPQEEVMEQLTQLVTIEAVGQQAGNLLMLHACALANPTTGEAVLLVGPSGMGKTTVAATLGSHWAYLSDETAALTEAGELIGYPKPLSVHSDSHAGKDQVSPAALGLVPMVGSARVRAVVLLRRDPEAAETVVEKVPTVQAVALLAEHTSYLSTLDRPLHRLAALLTSTGGLTQVTYREAEDLAPLVAELIGGGRMRIERTPILDEYAEDGTSVVMLPDGRVLALSELATAVLDSVGSSSLAVAELAERLVEAFGPPVGDPTGMSTTRDVVATMSESGLLKVLTSVK